MILHASLTQAIVCSASVPQVVSSPPVLVGVILWRGDEAVDVLAEALIPLLSNTDLHDTVNVAYSKNGTLAMRKKHESHIPSCRYPSSPAPGCASCCSQASTAFT